MSLIGAAEQLTVAARDGDGIYSILRRYQLVDHACNINEFQRLNRLSTNSKLLVGRLYQLPIQVVEYDGSSIRSTTKNGDYDRAVAIKDFNDQLLEQQLRSQPYTVDKLLYIPFHLDNCSSTTITPLGREVIAAAEDPVAVPQQETTAGARVFTIFGPEYARVPLIDRTLAGRIFYIVSGHGGPDPGAVGRRNNHLLAEDEYAYDVSLRLCRKILEHGGTPYMIIRDENDGIRDERYLEPDTDETAWGGSSLPRSQKQRLFQRSDIINALYEENLAKGITDQTMLAIHVDSRHRGQRIDLFLYYPEGDPVGKRRAEKIQETIRTKYEEVRPGRGYSGSVSQRDLHMLRETKPSGVYIELGNIANSSDQQRIVSPANRQLLAEWIMLGLVE